MSTPIQRGAAWAQRSFLRFDAFLHRCLTGLGKGLDNTLDGWDALGNVLLILGAILLCGYIPASWAIHFAAAGAWIKSLLIALPLAALLAMAWRRNPLAIALLAIGICINLLTLQGEMLQQLLP